MKKPMLSTDKEKLFYVVQKEQPPESNLIRPKDMNNTSMIRVEDLDGDGTREAIVFTKHPMRMCVSMACSWRNREIRGLRS